MNRFQIGLLILPIALTSVSCSGNTDAADSAESVEVTTKPAVVEGGVPGQHLKYTCDENKTFEVFFEQDKARVVLSPEQTIEMPQVKAKSGARYVSEPYVLRVNGNRTFIKENAERTFSKCAGTLVQP